MSMLRQCYANVKKWLRIGRCQVCHLCQVCQKPYCV